MITKIYDSLTITSQQLGLFLWWKVLELMLMCNHVVCHMPLEGIQSYENFNNTRNQKGFIIYNLEHGINSMMKHMEN
jgi:hypothetical protein